MSSRKKPSSLESLAERTVFQLIIASFAPIGQYNTLHSVVSEECKRRLTRLNEFLKCNVRPCYLNSMCSQRHKYKTQIRPYYLLAALVHPTMRELKLCHEDSIFRSQTILPELLKDLKLLKVLHLKDVCTDAILQVVCDNCTLLTELLVTSNSHSLTDKGLKEIVKLTNLTSLYLDYPRFDDGNAIRGIRYLVPLLTRLEVLKFSHNLLLNRNPIYMIHNYTSPLPKKLPLLKSVRCIDSDIKELIILCPSIQDLSVFSEHYYPSDDTLSQIANSDWILQRIKFDIRLGNTHSLDLFFRAKGTYITHLCLYLRVDNSRDSCNIGLLIGLHCPNITSLRLHLKSKIHSPLNIHTPHPIFGKLESFHLEYNSSLLIFFLKHASEIKNLTLQVFTSGEDISNELRVSNESMQMLIEDGLLKNLETLKLFDDEQIYLSRSVIISLIDSCPLLKHLVICSCYITNNIKEFLNTYITENNLDLEFSDEYDWKTFDTDPEFL